MSTMLWQVLTFLATLRPVSGMTCSSTMPLVWRINQGPRFAYIAGIYNLPSSKGPPLEGGPMAEALACCDVAYFPTGCSLADKSNVTGVGNYMAHCNYYPVTREKDTIAERLTTGQLLALKGALQNLTTYAKPVCKESAREFVQSSSVKDLNSSNYRTTLLSLFHKSVEAINPLWCTDSGEPSMESFLRRQWGQRKPIFGLEDISVECQVLQGNTVAEDQELATYMTDHFNQQGIANISDNRETMEQVMKCGDLLTLKTLVERMKGLPLSSERNLQGRNSNLAWGVQKALDANKDKNIFFAIPVTHLIDAAGREGVLTLLAKAGLNATRQSPSGSSGCQGSSYEAPGAAALNHCLKPPAQSQPLSCIQFEKQFTQILGKDVLHGRKVVEGPNCETCVNSTKTCTCQMKWTNYENFVNLCETTQVDGYHGQVYYLDMKRNPGSTREGLRLAEKTVAGLQQKCYASSCEIPIIQEMETRNWYKNDKSLDIGSVTVRKLDQPYGFEASIGSSFNWWTYVMGTILLLCCAAGLLRAFFLPPWGKGKKLNTWEHGEDIAMKGDTSETEPLKVPMNARDLFDSRFRDVQNLGTLPTGTDLQMPDMGKYPMNGPSGLSNVGSFPGAPPPPVAYPPAPASPQRSTPPALSHAPAITPAMTPLAPPMTYQGSLQGYQGSLPPLAAPLAAPAYPMAMPVVADTSLMALSGALTSQLESSGAEAIRSLRHGQLPAAAPAPQMAG
ncbi:unnamed protein product, partial [Cladocopium goreaui]